MFRTARHWCAAIVLCAIGQIAAAEPVTIFAASSLKTALDKVLPQLPAPSRVAYGGSAAMARQVAQGAGADIVLLAHPEWMDWLNTQGVLADGRCDLLSNQLVLAKAKNAKETVELSLLSSPADLAEALGQDRLAVGTLRSVPAGQYAANALGKLGWLEVLRPQLAEFQTVRQVLAATAQRAVPFGIVYASDVAAEPLVESVFVFPDEYTGPIRYPLALTKTGSMSDPARKVHSALIAAQDSFLTSGFTPVPLDVQGACP